MTICRNEEHITLDFTNDKSESILEDLRNFEKLSGAQKQEKFGDLMKEVGKHMLNQTKAIRPQIQLESLGESMPTPSIHSNDKLLLPNFTMKGELLSQAKLKTDSDITKSRESKSNKPKYRVQSIEELKTQRQVVFKNLTEK